MQYVVFYYLDWEELAAYSVNGTFPGEASDTRDLLAYERGIDPEDISFRIEDRKPRRVGF